MSSNPRECLWKSGVNHITKGCPAFLADTGLRTSPAAFCVTVVCVTKYVGGMQTQWKAAASLTLPQKSDFSEANLAGKKEFSHKLPAG